MLFCTFQKITKFLCTFKERSWSKSKTIPSVNNSPLSNLLPVDYLSDHVTRNWIPLLLYDRVPCFMSRIGMIQTKKKQKQKNKKNIQFETKCVLFWPNFPKMHPILQIGRIVSGTETYLSIYKKMTKSTLYLWASPYTINQWKPLQEYACVSKSDNGFQSMPFNH